MTFIEVGILTGVLAVLSVNLIMQGETTMEQLECNGNTYTVKQIRDGGGLVTIHIEDLQGTTVRNATIKDNAVTVSIFMEKFIEADRKTQALRAGFAPEDIRLNPRAVEVRTLLSWEEFKPCTCARCHVLFHNSSGPRNNVCEKCSKEVAGDFPIA